MIDRPQKSTAIKAAVKYTPKYAGLLEELQSSLGFSKELYNLQSKIGSYVLMYDDERKIGRCAILAMLGDDKYKNFVEEYEALPETERQEFFEYLFDEDNEVVQWSKQFEIPKTSSEWEDSRRKLLTLTPEERHEAEKIGTYIWCFFFSSFFNTLSLMVHGSKLTALVPKAMAGDDDAFLKAVQIDRQLLISHPDFKSRKLKAQIEQDKEFLSKIAYRESNSPLKGKVRYPALYMLFGILESLRWLDDLKHEELLDICYEAKLDRFQNRIDDVGYLTKRLIDYRKWQKLNSKSML
jgi:DNA-binding MarR family transcriptional regulator